MKPFAILPLVFGAFLVVPCFRRASRGFLLFGSLVLAMPLVHAEDGYELWLRYRPLAEKELDPIKAMQCGVGFSTMYSHSWTTDITEAAARELDRAKIRFFMRTEKQVPLTEFVIEPGRSDLGDEGFEIQSIGFIRIIARTDRGILYGAFALIRHWMTHPQEDPVKVAFTSVPRIQHRLLNHWDGLNGLVERGQAGDSIFDWFQLPDYVSPRITDYGRACASIGLNGAVLTNVNANALVLTPEYLEKVKALADTLRPWGVRVYLTARFSAPVEIGGLKTADPLEPAVRDWWKEKATEIYALVPDFGGFLVKANSEGQPGPQDYGRSHADGANLLADAVGPFGGIVMWRAFVYSHEQPEDRAKQAYDEFVPLDGEFRDNVLIQIKNGPIDFMPREPFHPLFGAMPQTPPMPELQIAQEYLGGAIHLAYLGPLFEEVLDADTYVRGEGTTVARIVEGKVFDYPQTGIAGVANIGDDRNWTGHPLAQANWYAFGRLAWDPALGSATIAEEWVRQTFGNDPEVISTLVPMLMETREAVVDYSMPLGLHHIMEVGHHYGPGPWINPSGGMRADWTSTYYHRADEDGIGFDRISSGSNALAQYAPALATRWENPATTPEKFLLWFHHLPWDYEMVSGRTLWDELAWHYQHGVEKVRAWRETWAGLANRIDPERHAHVAALLARQEHEAEEWRDACLLYFQQFSQRPLPEGVEAPARALQEYIDVDRRYVPGNPSGY